MIVAEAENSGGDSGAGTGDGPGIVSLHAGYETDGVYTNAFLARPEEGTARAGMVLLSGMGGLTWAQREITRLYARAGFVALSPDFMGGELPDDRTVRLHAKNSLDVTVAVAGIIGGAAFLHSLPWVGPEAGVGIMGFCLGGGLALLAAGRSDAFAAGIIYHQSLFPDVRELQGIDCKLQCHYGTEDHSTPREEVEAFARALEALGKSYELHWYEGMGHSFAQIAPDAEVPDHQRAAADLSYQRSFAFLGDELGA
ncbi:MAG: dienelactone hydrolase family protein [Alphaproteobacteria bacterium]